jgi:RNA polymerase sigma factor (sigma-70 family)
MATASTGGQASAEAARADRAVRLGGCLERARGGERGALDEVVRELNPLLWRVARAEGLGAEDAADVVQTVWLELVRRLDDIRSPQSLIGWLVTAARREAWRVHARLRRQRPAATGVPGPEPESVPDDAPEPSERLLTDERDRVLYEHFRRLSERCRFLLGIVAQAERPDYAMVSEALNMPHGSIGPTRGRCLAKLREMLLGDPRWSAR